MLDSVNRSPVISLFGIVGMIEVFIRAQEGRAVRPEKTRPSNFPSDKADKELTQKIGIRNKHTPLFFVSKKKGPRP